MPETVLGFSDINGCSNIQNLREVYERAGLTFNQVDEMFPQLQYDWQNGVDEQWTQRQASPHPDRIPSEDVIVDGKTYHLYGIAHNYTGGLEYMRSVTKTVAQTEGAWFHESGMQWFFLGLRGNSLEVLDYSALGFSGNFKEAAKIGLAMPFAVAFMGLAYAIYQTWSSIFRRIKTES